jgi:hypothetical protein
MQDLRLDNEKKRLRSVIDYYDKKGVPAPEKLLFPKPGDYYHNEFISDEDRKKLYTDIMNEKTKAKESQERRKQQLQPDTSGPQIDQHRMGYGGYLLPRRSGGSYGVAKTEPLDKDAKDPNLAPKELKIKQLKAQVQSGQYKPNAGKIAEKMIERGVFNKGGQWSIQKWDMEKRCWEGYEPTPGKKPYEKGSCQPVKKDEKIEIAPKGSNNKKTFEEVFAKSEQVGDDEFEIIEWDNGDVDIVAGQNFPEEDLDFLCKSLCEKADLEEISKKEKNWSPKAEHKSDKGGLTAAGRESYNRATGGNLKPPQPGGGPRKRSFCARNKGQIEKYNIDCRANPEKRACKARRRWKCRN